MEGKPVKDENTPNPQNPRSLGASVGALALVPHFTGARDSQVSIHDFLEALDQVAAMEGWKEDQALGALKLMIKGEARTFLGQQKAGLTLAEAKNLLKARFSHKVSIAKVLTMLTDPKMKPRETPRGYFQRLLGLRDRALAAFEAGQRATATPLIEGAVLATLKRTIAPERVKNYLIIKGVDTLEAAKGAIEEAESHELDYYAERSVFSLREDRYQSNGARGRNDQRNRGQAYSGTGRGGNNNRNQSRGGKREDRTCYNCNKVGHISNDCRVKGAGTPRSARTNKWDDPDRPQRREKGQDHSKGSNQAQGGNQRVVCLRCKKEGHFHKECKVPRCWGCNELYHMEKNCPKLAQKEQSEQKGMPKNA